MTDRKVSAPLPLPSSWSDISPAWMTRALAGDFPGAEVTKVDIAFSEDGTNRRARLELAYGAGVGPETVFLKANDPAHAEVHLRNGNLFNEARLFQSVSDLPLEHPKVYQSMLDEKAVVFCLLMEDIKGRGGDPVDALRPMTPDRVARGLEGLAALHSRYWQRQAAYTELTWVQTWAPTEGWQVGLKRRIPIGLERASGTLPSTVDALSAEQVVEFWARYVGTLTQGPVTLLHGDAHIGNTYLMPDGGVGFLDWQVVRWGEWSQDVGYFLVSALTEEDRRTHEAALVDHYRQALDVPEAERPTAEAAWARYRTTPAYGLAIWLSTLGTDGWQSREVSLTLARRFASAFDELNTVAALEELGA